MSEKNQPPLSGISVAAIEAELNELWEGMAREKEGSHEAVMRTRVFNVVIYAPGTQASSEVGQVMGEVAVEHPSRILLLLPREDASAGSLSAMVTAQCHPGSGGRQQVCCEQIQLRAEGDAVKRLASAVRPLLVPDLPTVLWWRDEPRLEFSLFSELEDLAVRVIVDSDRFADTGSGFRQLSEVVGQSTAGFSDLAWGRMNAWRRQVAAFFNVPEYRDPLSQIHRLEIECGRSKTGQLGLSAAALLTACWLSSRLKWTPHQAFEWVDDASCQTTLDGPNGKVEIAITVKDGQPGLQKIRMICGAEPTSEFEVRLDSKTSSLVASARFQGTPRIGKVSQFQVRGEAYLLARELEILGRDRVYEQALGIVGKLAN